MAMSEYYEVLTEITIDHYSFRATWSPSSGQACILWIRDSRHMQRFEPLGRFSVFDKRSVLEFVVRYVTNPRLREEIGRRRFELYLQHISPAQIDAIAELDREERERAFRSLFNLDSVIDEAVDLAWKRRRMARKFHPDCGGESRRMSLINEAYDALTGKGQDDQGD